MIKPLCKHVFYAYGYETSVSSSGNRVNTIYGFKCRKCGFIKRIKTHGHDYILTPGMISSKNSKK